MHDHRRRPLTVLALPWVALDHLVAGLKAREGHLRDGVLLVVRLLGGDDGRERSEGEVNTRETVVFVRHRNSSPCEHTHGTKLVWNSFKSTFREPSNRSEAVMEETTCAMRRLRLTKPGEVIPSLFLQMS